MTSRRIDMGKRRFFFSSTLLENNKVARSQKFQQYCTLSKVNVVRNSFYKTIFNMHNDTVLPKTFNMCFEITKNTIPTNVRKIDLQQRCQHPSLCRRFHILLFRLQIHNSQDEDQNHLIEVVNILRHDNS